MIKKSLFFIIALALMVVPKIALAQTPFDFSDDFYRQNGVNPDAILERIKPDVETVPGSGAILAITGTAPNANRNNTQITETTGGFDMDGNLIYYTVMGKIPDHKTFTADPFGLNAFNAANKYRAFIFPRRTPGNINQDNNLIRPGAPNARQNNLFETKTGYFDLNPLGLWWIMFVTYTDAAVVNPSASVQADLDAMAAKNGTDLDGTPVLKRLSEINEFALKGLVRVRGRALDGSEGFPWVL